MKDYLIGIDAGGSTTIAVAFDAAGREIARAVGGAANLTNDFTGGVEEILATLRRLTAQLPGQALGLCAGCAGVEAGDRKQRLTAVLKRETALPYLHVTNDALPALYAAHGEEDGILLIAGTGSIAYARVDGCIRRAGGWGHLIGDDGSGWRIAMDAIRSVTDGFDRGESAGGLQKAILTTLGARDAFGVVQFVYAASKREIAALAPVVERCAREGDATATAILQKAGQSLAGLVLTLCPSGRSAPFRVAAVGGIITNVALVRESFLAALSASEKPTQFLTTPPDPAYGGYVLLRSLYPELREGSKV